MRVLLFVAGSIVAVHIVVSLLLGLFSTWDRNEEDITKWIGLPTVLDLAFGVLLTIGAFSDGTILLKIIMVWALVRLIIAGFMCLFWPHGKLLGYFGFIIVGCILAVPSAWCQVKRNARKRRKEKERASEAQENMAWCQSKQNEWKRRKEEERVNEARATIV